MIILHRESIYEHLEFILKSSIEKRVAINSKSLLSTRAGAYFFEKKNIKITNKCYRCCAKLFVIKNIFSCEICSQKQLIIKIKIFCTIQWQINITFRFGCYAEINAFNSHSTTDVNHLKFIFKVKIEKGFHHNSLKIEM